MKHIKCIVAGDSYSEKTKLITYIVTNTYPGENIPNISDTNYNCNAFVDGIGVHINFWDTACTEDYKYMRKQSYPQTDVFLLCFSLVHPESLETIKSLIPEMKETCPDAPFILLGTHSDLRDNFGTLDAKVKTDDMEPIPRAVGEKLTQSIHAYSYIETNFINHSDIIDEIARAALKRKDDNDSLNEESKSSCNIF